MPKCSEHQIATRNPAIGRAKSMQPSRETSRAPRMNRMVCVCVCVCVFETNSICCMSCILCNGQVGWWLVGTEARMFPLLLLCRLMVFIPRRCTNIQMLRSIPGGGGEVVVVAASRQAKLCGCPIGRRAGEKDSGTERSRSFPRSPYAPFFSQHCVEGGQEERSNNHHDFRHLPFGRQTERPYLSIWYCPLTRRFLNHSEGPRM